MSSAAHRASRIGAMGALQPLHLVVILVIVLVIFGAGRLSDVGSALGKGVKDFRSNVADKDKAVASPSTGFCASCGARLPEGGARFCSQCGTASPA